MGEVKMNSDTVIDIARETISTLLMVSMPLLMVSLIVGVVIALFQALTQIQEMTLTFVPKILAVFTALIFLAPFIGSTIFKFSESIFSLISVQ